MELRHLRYFTEPVWGWVAFVQPFGIYAGFAMAAGLAGLFSRGSENFDIDFSGGTLMPFSFDHTTSPPMLISPASGASPPRSLGLW